MSAKFDAAARQYMNARATVDGLIVDLMQAQAATTGLQFTPATVAKFDAAMSKVQMIARKIVEASIDAQVECGIASAEDASA